MRQIKPVAAVIIPAFNEQSTISSVLATISPKYDVVVVDDCSTDDTSRIARARQAIVLNHHSNRGYESSLETGITYAMKQGYKYIITMDADGQHNADDLDRMLVYLNSGFQMVLGARKTYNRIAETIVAPLYSMLFNINDPFCGFRAYSTSSLGMLDSLDPQKTAFLLVTTKLIRLNTRHKNIVVHTKERSGPARYGTGLKVNLRLLRAAILGIYLS